MTILDKSRIHELVMTRDFAAPRERVFAAWTDVRQASRWWVPQGFTTLACRMDVRPGGVWYRRMRAPDGAIYEKQGVYREVTAPERLVFTYTTSGPGVADPETVVTVTFTDLGERTRLTLHQSVFASDDSRADHRGGWTGALDRLATFISTDGAAP